MNDIGYMLRRSFRFKGLIAASVLMTALQCAMKMRLPVLMSEAVNIGLQKKDLYPVLNTGLHMFISCIIMGVSGYLAHVTADVTGQRTALELRKEMYRKISDLSVSQVSLFGAGSLITRLTTDIDICAMLVHAILFLVIEPVFMMLGGVWLMWRISSLFGLVFLFFVAAQLSVVVIFIRRTAPGFVRVRSSMDAINGGLQNTFSVFRLIRASGTQTLESGYFNARNTDFFQKAYDVQKLIAFFNPLIMLIMNLSVACVLFISGWEVSSSRLNIGMLLMAISYSEQVLMSIMTGGQMYRMITETKPSAHRIRQVLNTVPEMVDLESAVSLTEPFDELRFESVEFEYPETGRVLKSLNFSIRKGETAAVTGPIGSGKSTMAALCARLCDVTGGRILLNGRDIRSVKMEDLHRMVALVEKHPPVVEGSLYENITFGRRGITANDVQKAAGAAQFLSYLNSESASASAERSLLSTGNSLSGGERQCLAITRAMAGSPGLLVLDEGTSSLDYETEKQLLSALRKEYPDLAILLITSRIPTARRAERILILDQGREAAVGSDRELLADCEIYRRMCGIYQDV